MGRLQYQRRLITAAIRNPLKNFALTEDTIEVRSDPLTGRSMRISKAKGLDKLPEGEPLMDIVRSASSCFFCAGRVENQTPMLPENILPEGRIQVGDALLFPNLSGFGRYSGVCIFSGEHFIHLDQFTEEQILNALIACRTFFRKCSAGDPDPLYPTLNGNYLLPAGSSILHPHLQPYLDPFPTNHQREMLQASEQYLREQGSHYWDDLRESERQSSRFLWESAQFFWHTPFAPLGFNEINALPASREPFADFSDELLGELAQGLQRIFRFYSAIGHNSFNLTLFSPPVNSPKPDGVMPCLLKIVTRPTFAPHYRNDVTFFEKLHLESMIDRSPEEVAADFHQKALD